MDNYAVYLSPKAIRDLDAIYEYIRVVFKAPETTSNLVNLIEKSILSLNEKPYRGATRKTGMYAGKGYRQLFVKNYTIVYRVNENDRSVIVITVKYSAANF